MLEYFRANVLKRSIDNVETFEMRPYVKAIRTRLMLCFVRSCP